jgi:forespore regulator of the sigma-K checkpoint
LGQNKVSSLHSSFTNHSYEEKNEVTSMLGRIIIFICTLTLAISIFLFTSTKEAKDYEAKTDEGIHVATPLQVKVILQREYLDGEMSHETVNETIWAMEDFWAKYDHWQLVDMDENIVIFKQQVEDISPLLKANGYFGVSKDGTLAIFNGKTNPSTIIQSFFQIDLSKLESKKREELMNGIPVRTKERYFELIETFKSYSLPQQ